MKRITYFIPVILFFMVACGGDPPAPISSTNNNSNSCSTTGTIQDTITVNGTDYSIVSTSGLNNTLLVELINKNGTYSANITMHYLQAKKGGLCYQNNNSTPMTGSQYKAYSFNSFPSWVIDTNTVTVAKLTIDSTDYFLKDNKLNK